MLVVVVLCIVLNWGIYVYVVNFGYVVEVVFGYFINLIVMVFVGVFVLCESLSWV